MHKFTIFTIIFSIIIVFIVANLIITDFRDNTKDGNNAVLVLSEDVKANVAATEPAPTSSATTEKIKVELDDKMETSNVKVLNNDYWLKIGLNEADIASKEFNERIFTILSPNNNGTLKVYKNFIKAGDLQGVEIYEVIMADNESALTNYEEMLKMGQKSILFSANPTNDFGNKSFYLNDELKKDSVFLIILRENVIYGLAYPKGKHQSLLNLFKELP